MSSPPNVLSHPVVNALLSKLRQSSTSSKEFREGIHNISFILGIEATRTLEEETFDGVFRLPQSNVFSLTPLTSERLLVPSSGMTDALLTLFPEAPVYHLGLYREKVTLHPVEYYSKLPPIPPVEKVFVLDPLIATGNTACAALTMIIEWGVPVSQIKLLGVIASKQGLGRIKDEYPELEIWVAAIDENLTKEGIINPGLGDTGDRLFNTVHM